MQILESGVSSSIIGCQIGLCNGFHVLDLIVANCSAARSYSVLRLDKYSPTSKLGALFVFLYNCKPIYLERT
jgi:hypothetical protein